MTRRLHHKLIFIAAIILLFAASSCKKMRNLQEGQTFLKYQNIEVHDPNKEYVVTDEEILALSRLKANRRILWFRLNHSIYLLVDKKKLALSEEKAEAKCVKKNARRLAKKKLPKEECKTWHTFWAYTVGERTAVLDTVKLKKTTEQMVVYLKKKGFFDVRVEPKIKYSSDHENCKVTFHIYPGDPYHLRKIEYEIVDSAMVDGFRQYQKNALLKEGLIFDVDLLDAEREGISTYFNNKGYYEFTKDYIVYDADSTVGSHKVDINMILNQSQAPVPNYPDSIMILPHKKYFIGNIDIHTHYDATRADYIPSDTLQVEGMNVMCYKRPDINSKLIACTQGFMTGDLFQRDKIDKTYKRYTQLGAFKATTIQLIPRTGTPANVNILDTRILLTPAKRQLFGFDPKMTNREGYLGIYGNLVYRHKNLFHGAESMEFRIISGLEATQPVAGNNSTDGGSNDVRGSFRLNTFEIGPELTLRIPRTLFRGCDFSGKISDPQTAISTALSYQKRPDYERTLSQFRWSYSELRGKLKNKRVNIDWVDFSVIKINKTAAFEAFIDELNDIFLDNSYNDHLIFSVAYPTMTLNSQKQKFQRYYYYLRLGFGGAGNLVKLAYDIAGATKDALGSYEIAGIRFAQYTRLEVDFRNFLNTDEKNNFVLRSYAGVGNPYGNLQVLPFEKSFFSGGSNGIRAWQARTLGPGSYRNTTPRGDSTNVRSFNNIGDIKLEGNFEYRFKVTKMFRGAIFVDAGNIWLIRPDERRPNAEFEFDRFISEIAIGTGIGARLDFDYFLVRLDLGFQLKDPTKVQGERWLWQPKDEYNAYLEQYFKGPSSRNSPLVFNLGIGYPF
jgi:outer membrane translocation and assembly module TamA